MMEGDKSSLTLRMIIMDRNKRERLNRLVKEKDAQVKLMDEKSRQLKLIEERGKLSEQIKEKVREIEKIKEEEEINLDLANENIANEIYDKHSKTLDQMYEDPAFQKAFEALDVEKLSEAFDGFQKNARSYNTFHTQERRLWSVKIGRGQINKAQELKFRESIPVGRENYISAFDNLDVVHNLLDQADFGPIIEEYLPTFTSVLTNSKDPITKAVKGLAGDIGCTEIMTNEFIADFAKFDSDILKVSGGFNGLAKASRLGVEAQLKILKETELNGFDYVRGHCGPPAWAVSASALLASIGIAVSAWWLVAGIFVFLAILVALCIAAKRNNWKWTRAQCKKLSVKIPALAW